jgi:hypothetical protein
MTSRWLLDTSTLAACSIGGSPGERRLHPQLHSHARTGDYLVGGRP